MENGPEGPCCWALFVNAAKTMETITEDSEKAEAELELGKIQANLVISYRQLA